MTTPARTERQWDADRLDTFSDAVMAVIITLMAISLRPPDGTSWRAVSQRFPALLIYILSFTAIGMAWNHHHHLLRAIERISTFVMWANLHQLFWLSLVPLVTEWVGTDHSAHLPACAYGVVALGATASYTILARAIVIANRKEPAVSTATRSDRKSTLTVVLYAVGAGLAWLTPWISYGLYAAVAIVWFIPDSRFARQQVNLSIDGDGPRD
jgi:uncharacterized membrane protein